MCSQWSTLSAMTCATISYVPSQCGTIRPQHTPSSICCVWQDKGGWAVVALPSTRNLDSQTANPRPGSARPSRWPADAGENKKKLTQRALSPGKLGRRHTHVASTEHRTRGCACCKSLAASRSTKPGTCLCASSPRGRSNKTRDIKKSQDLPRAA